jgi:integrase
LARRAWPTGCSGDQYEGRPLIDAKWSSGGLDVMFVQQIMGHSTLEVLRKHYLSRLDIKKALAAMERLYGRGG